MQKVPKKLKDGYTLLEILIVVAVLVVIATLTAEPLLTYYRNIRFQGAVENVLTMLDEARKSTLSSYESSQYGVHFEAERVVLFKGDTFVDLDPDNDEFYFSNEVTISTTSFTGGGDDVLFERITGETGNSGTLGVSLLIGATTTKVITIHQSVFIPRDGTVY